MIVRFNSLKILVLAGEAKPGGNIGAMLSPYLFSLNMNDFCKKFNEQTRDYALGVWLPVSLYCDVIEKTYSFVIKKPSFPLFYNLFFASSRKITIANLYDLVVLYSHLYKLTLHVSAFILYACLKSFRRRFAIISISDCFCTRARTVS